MQVGDPFMGKLLLEACLELFGMDVLEGIQDMGAAGLTSSSVEMAGRAKNGIEIDLDLVPRRAKRMTPYEILLSESQERMLLVAKPGQAERVLAVCKKWDLDAAVIGRVTDTKRWVVKATPGYDPLADSPSRRDSIVVCDLPIAALTDDAPAYDRPRAKQKVETDVTQMGKDTLAPPEDLRAELLALLGSPNIGSRRWIWRQYDHVVRGGTLVRPGSDAGVVRVPCARPDGRVVEKFLAFSVDCNARHTELDPFVGGALAVAEACRNLVCSGAEPIGLTDCLNFGNPERPEVMDSFARAINGIAAACNALGVPIVSGNVSLYNETDGRPILPTPTIAAVGLVSDPGDIVTQWFKRPGDAVVLLGPAEASMRELGGSEYLCRKLGRVAGDAQLVDLPAEAKLQKLVLELARARLLVSAHDVAEGGLAVALAECCTTGPDPASDTGARVDLPGEHARPEDVPAYLFGEAASRVVLSVRKEDLGGVVQRAREAGVPAHDLGVTGGDSLSIAFVSRHGEVARLGALLVKLEEVRTRRESCLEAIVGG
jgi:phosphoribosylformylglycinamidine synthase subunit PurL